MRQGRAKRSDRKRNRRNGKFPVAQPQLEFEIMRHVASATSCGNCLEQFSNVRKKQRIAVLYNFVANRPVYSIYALCNECSERLDAFGSAGISIARDDARLAALTLATSVGGVA